MSREILFKAKRKNWRELPKEEWWVEGNLITNEREEGTAYIGYIFDVHNGVIEDFDIVEIDPETLCQYTGLNDKNCGQAIENERELIMTSEFYKPLTPSFRNDINTAIENQIKELNTCKGNAFVNMQIIGLTAHKNLINALPDGYPIPCKK